MGPSELFALLLPISLSSVSALQTHRNSSYNHIEVTSTTSALTLKEVPLQLSSLAPLFSSLLLSSLALLSIALLSSSSLQLSTLALLFSSLYLSLVLFNSLQLSSLCLVSSLQLSVALISYCQSGVWRHLMEKTKKLFQWMKPIWE